MIEITMRLEEREAEAVATVLHYIGGSPKGPKGVFEALANALDERGIHPSRALLVPGTNRGIYFKDRWLDQPDRNKIEVKRK